MAAESLETVASIAWRLVSPTSQIVTLVLAIKLARLSNRLTTAVETIERVGPLVEGDPKEHQDNAKRYGILGRVSALEGIADAGSKKLELFARRVVAVLRGMNVPSDLSDDRELERRVKDALKGTQINRLAATDALVTPTKKRKE